MPGRDAPKGRKICFGTWLQGVQAVFPQIIAAGEHAADDSCSHHGRPERRKTKGDPGAECKLPRPGTSRETTSASWRFCSLHNSTTGCGAGISNTSVGDTVDSNCNNRQFPFTMSQFFPAFRSTTGWVMCACLLCSLTVMYPNNWVGAETRLCLVTVFSAPQTAPNTINTPNKRLFLKSCSFHLSV